MKQNRAGTSLIDLVIAMTIVALLFGGIYLVYFSIITAVANISVRSAAAAAIGNEVELLRNLPYADVGTIGGVPSGVIPATQSVTEGNYSFTLGTVVLNIHDPFDSNPNDTTATDYKLVSVTATCPLCDNPMTVTITTTVAPNGNAIATQTGGALFISALDANGNPVPNAVVTVVNASVTPSIDLTDTANASGVLELIGAPTSTQGYWISVTRPGYSTDETYPPGGAANPDPVKPNATVAANSATRVSFAIDRLSSLAVSASDNRCNAIGNEPFTMQGAKIIGYPNVLKFSTSSTMDAQGTAMFASLEWDTYTLADTDPSYDVAGTIPLDPVVVNPSSTDSFQFILQPAANPSLLATVEDGATGAGIPDAIVTLSTSTFSETLTTGHATVANTSWTGGAYASQSGGIDASTPGELTLLVNASGTYSTSTASWLISNTIDLGGANAALYAMAWTAGTMPANTSVAFQIAANNDNATWNFIGPDGTGSTYFTAPSSTLPAALSGNRFLRYKVFLDTQDANAAPSVTGISFDFSANCVPPAQVLFTTLPQGSYTLGATAANYYENTSTVVVGAGFQSSVVPLTHQ